MFELEQWLVAATEKDLLASKPKDRRDEVTNLHPEKRSFQHGENAALDQAGGMKETQEPGEAKSSRLGKECVTRK